MSEVGLRTPRPRAVAIVWRRDGWPAIDAEWVKGLTPYERGKVDAALAVRGFRLNGFTVEEVDYGDSFNGCA